MRLGLEPSAKLVLLSFGEDQLLEYVDATRSVTIPAIADLGFDLVTAVGYSVYDEDWPPETMNNQMRSLISFGLLQDRGAVCIPFVAWADDREREAHVEWIGANEPVTMVAFDLQSCDEPTRWRRFLPSLEKFHSALPRKLEYLVSGVARPDRIASLRNILGDFHLTNGYPYHMARVGQEDFGGALLRDAQRSSAPRMDIFSSYHRYFERLMIGEAEVYVPTGERLSRDRPGQESFVGEGWDTEPRGGAVSAAGKGGHR